ncbi:Lectin C-type domain [Halocaridina rubra]|uniref:Lectin C-type domain n=1 Tax=Halocaridina rubra TaxID=373956 RepID=A0AAN9A9F6_HALRR
MDSHFQMKLLVIVSLATVASAQFSVQHHSEPFFLKPTNFRRIRSADSGVAVDGTLGISEYHYSWLHDGKKEYIQSEAAAYCNSLGTGWAPVNIESQEENAFVSGVIKSHRLDWLWTGGQKDGSCWKWPSGSSFDGFGWSHTGGFHSPQPDNREGNENCLAILNDFYRDGIKWHDVACYHEKPTICERKA